MSLKSINHIFNYLCIQQNSGISKIYNMKILEAAMYETVTVQLVGSSLTNYFHYLYNQEILMCYQNLHFQNSRGSSLQNSNCMASILPSHKPSK